MSDLENSYDECDETYIPLELENESDYDDVPVESYSCQSIDQLKDNEKDNDEKGSTVKLRDSQNGDKSTNSLMDDSVAKNHLSQEQPNHKRLWRAKKPPALTQSFVGSNLATL